MLYPFVWIEDDFYFESAFLASRGLRPYLDFVHTHMPVLEFFTALHVKIFGASHRSLELLSEATYYLSSLLVFRLAARCAGRRPAILAALLYASASLLFRYHVYEREIFLTPLLLGAALIASRKGRLSPRAGASLSLLMTLACSVKLTAAISCVVILAYLFGVRRRRAAALCVGAGLVAGLGALTATFTMLYGEEFLFQTFLFHFLKGAATTYRLALFPRNFLDVTLPLFAIGCVSAIVLQRRAAANHVLGLTLGCVAANYLFLGWLSPTAWPHNYLDVIPFMAPVSGLGLDRIIGSARNLRAGGSGRPAALGWILGGGATLTVGLVWLTPLVNDNWIRNSVYGFGYLSRAELAVISGAIRGASTPEEPIIAPPFLCFEANRRTFIAYPETYGVYRAARRAVARDGFAAARAFLGKLDFAQLIDVTSPAWVDEMTLAIADGRVNLVVYDEPLLLRPYVAPPLMPEAEQFLSPLGFVPLLRTRHCTVWVRAKPTG